VSDNQGAPPGIGWNRRSGLTRGRISDAHNPFVPILWVRSQGVFLKQQRCYTNYQYSKWGLVFMRENLNIQPER